MAENLYWPSGTKIDTEWEAYDNGYKTGLNWNNSWYPGGPWVAFKRWDDRCVEQVKQTEINNQAWRRGFDAGVKDQKKE